MELKAYLEADDDASAPAGVCARVPGAVRSDPR
jgi:hypothetical protein